jgi:hypothetical protein
LGVTVTALDLYENTATGYTGLKSLAWTGPASSPSGEPTEYPSSATEVTFSSGVGMATGIKLFNASITSTLTATEGSIHGTSGTFTVKAAGVESFRFGLPITAKTAGTEFLVLPLNANDQYGNTNTTYTGSKTLVWTGPANSPNNTAPVYPTHVTFSGGVGTATGFKLYDAQSTTLTATEGSTTGSSNSFTVNAAPAKRLAWTGATVSAGILTWLLPPFTSEDTALEHSNTFKAMVSVTDEWGNIVSALGAGHKVRLTKIAAGSSVSPTELIIPETLNATTAEVTYTSPPLAEGAGNDTLKAETTEGLTYAVAEANLHY